MTAYEDLDAVELRAELEDWTQRALQWADDIAQAVEHQDFWRAVFMLHGYKQARLQVRRIKHAQQIGVA